MVGKKFNRLTVVSAGNGYVTPKGAKCRTWICKCDCGKLTEVTTSHLKSGHTKSCGCYAHEMSLSKEVKYRKHGLTFREKRKPIRLFRIWTQMKTRCYNKKDEHYKNYGGRGIKVCKEWSNDFKAFYEWSMSNGYSDELTIDRVDVNGNYEPTNCRWVTQRIQVLNRRNSVRVTYNGITKTLKEWSESLGIGYQTLYYRYKSGKTPDEILKH